MTPTTPAITVTDVAFGAHPGRLAEVTPSSSAPLTGIDAWSTAVALGAVGRYDRALTELRRLRAVQRHRSDVLASLAASTQASHLRQTGQHGSARRFDGVALSLAIGAPPGPIAAAATVDALVGLAADHLGLGRFDVADRLLDRATGVPVVRWDGETFVDWVWTDRMRLRIGWVRTESALYGGDPDRAGANAGAAALLAQGCPSVRHVIKTDLIAAAARAAGGDEPAAAVSALDCARRARDHALDPLLWAASALLLGLSGSLDASTAAEVAEEEAVVRRRLDARGGAFAAP